MSKRLFVGGLPFSVTDAELTELFSPFGTIVSSKVISDKFTGRSKGFGLVEFENDEDADKAIQSLNETEVQGRKIVVNVARPMEERTPRQFGGGNDHRSDDRRGGGFRRGDRR